MEPLFSAVEKGQGCSGKPSIAAHESKNAATRPTVNFRNSLRSSTSHAKEERTAVGWELHDEVDQTLSVVKMDLDVLRKTFPASGPASVHATMHQMETLLDRAIVTLRRLYMNLRPEMLNDLGLAATVEWQTAEFEKRSGMKCRIRLLDDVTLNDDNIRLAVYRVFQEALVNSVCHSDITAIDISVERHNDRATIVVQDNGHGNAEDYGHRSSTMGIIGMRERLSALGGKIEIVGTPDKGTVVRITVPLS